MKENQLRFVFIDLLRGWALIIMIEVHVFNAFILPELKLTDWFNLLNFINGLVAPSFLFVSGFAFIVSSERKIDELRKFGGYFWNKLRRIGLILLAGYSLHLPFFSLSKITESSYYHFISLFNVDILQCIAAGLLLLLFSRIIIKNNNLFYGLLALITILISIISPLVWKTDLSGSLPVFLASYFNKQFGSYFPLFPWLFFLFAGAFFSKLYIISRNEKREQTFMLKVFLYGLIPVVLGHFFFSDLFDFPVFSIRPNPFFLYQRLGYVLVLTSFFWYYNFKRKTSNSVVLDISRESLLVYWMHLQVIYLKIWGGKSIAEIISGSFSVIECVVFTLFLVILMILIAKLWGWFKKKYPEYARPAVSTIIILAVIIFVFR